MSCQACRKRQLEPVGGVYFRWKNANVELRACDKHAGEVIAALQSRHDAIELLERGESAQRAGMFSNYLGEALKVLRRAGGTS